MNLLFRSLPCCWAAAPSVALPLPVVALAVAEATGVAVPEDELDSGIVGGTARSVVSLESLGLPSTMEILGLRGLR